MKWLQKISSSQALLLFLTILEFDIVHECTRSRELFETFINKPQQLRIFHGCGDTLLVIELFVDSVLALMRACPDRDRYFIIKRKRPMELDADTETYESSHTTVGDGRCKVNVHHMKRR